MHLIAGAVGHSQSVQREFYSAGTDRRKIAEAKEVMGVLVRAENSRYGWMDGWMDGWVGG